MLFGLPGFLIAGIVAFTVFGGTAGLFWLFLFGDDPWPSSAETILLLLFTATFLITWVTLIVLGFLTGKKLENETGIDMAHILASVGIVLVFLAVIVIHQYRVGNLGPVTDSRLCGDYCLTKGYAASGMPPKNTGLKTCRCYDDQGGEAVTISLDEITLDK